jgi:hypothetical protein
MYSREQIVFLFASIIYLREQENVDKTSPGEWFGRIDSRVMYEYSISCYTCPLEITNARTPPPGQMTFYYLSRSL